MAGREWRPWQRRVEALLTRLSGRRLAHEGRMLLHYPTRRVRNIDSVLAPSIERQFVRPAGRWARGARPVPSQPATWRLADQPLETRGLCRAAWEG